MVTVATMFFIAISINPVELPQANVVKSQQSQISECKLCLDEAYKDREEIYKDSTLSFCTAANQ